MTEVAAEQGPPGKSNSILRWVVIGLVLLCVVGLYFFFDQWIDSIKSYQYAQEKYHAMESFKATGTLVYRRHLGVVPVVEEGTFSLAFRAPNRFHSHFIFNEGTSIEHHAIGWGEPEHAFLYRTREGSAAKEMESFSVANELLECVTSLLLEPVNPYADNPSGGRWKHVGTEDVNGVSCNHLELHFEMSDNTWGPMEAFWIGDDHLIRKHRMYLPRVSDSAYMEFTYADIQVDVPVSDEDLMPDLERFGIQRQFYSFRQ